jgi:crotonobetainyl-CoA:carnitine CoA-transferase CaiB-like acyl-CoA transferase
MGRAQRILEGRLVLDLSWGVSGPAAAMLLGDAGADVVKIEPPGGDPFRPLLSGYTVWQRNKRSAELDLTDPADRDVFYALVDRADVVLESFAPGVAAELGVDHHTLLARNPRLVHATITGYGLEGKHAHRPAYDALVSARTGHMWEARGTVGGTIARLAGVEGILPGVEAPEGCWVGAERPGPLMPGVPWASMATMYLTTLAINAALRVRDLTGRGQHVHTSLLQGAMCSTLGAWMRVEHPEVENFQTWITDPRAPRGFFKTADGRWTHHWVPLPGFIFSASAGDELAIPEGENPRKSSTRIGMHPEEMLVLHELTPLMAECVARFPAPEWERVAAQAGVPVQTVRSPEEALLDPLFVADGCVTEVDDPVHGRIRQVGAVINLSTSPFVAPRPAPAPGQHTEEVRALAASPAPEDAPAPLAAGRSLASPLDGIRVLDLGLAVAGPFGTQLLGDLGAEVIKVSTLTDDYWMSNHIAMCCNRGKRSIAINLKTADGMRILHDLVRTADVVQHNMRYDAAQRLGVDYESLRAIRPDLVYCHTRGFEKGPRTALPGNDQTGAALAGTEWLDGGLDHGGNPVWSTTSLGDTGNGFLSAIGIVQAIAHRDRTGEGQFLDTAIVYAQLLNASSAWITADGTTAGHRPSLDAAQLGWSALYRVYPCADGTWLCVVALDDSTFARLARSVGRDDLATDPRVATRAARAEHDAWLVDELGRVFAARPAAAWFAALDAAGVPCEVSDPDFVLSLFDDPEMIDKGWVARYRHEKVGTTDVMGLLFDFSETPGRIWGPPFVPGQHTGSILRELGYDDAAIAALVADRIVLDRDAAGTTG